MSRRWGLSAKAATSERTPPLSRYLPPQLTQQTAGNGVVTNRTYDPNTGLTQTIQAGVGNAVANYSFAFNTVGTLTSRTDATQSVSENFTYDTMNRLTQYAIRLRPSGYLGQVVGGSTKTVGYDALGSITSKSDVGAYAYPAAGLARPHAVGSITGAVNTIFTYDANGNMLAGQGRTVTYTSFNMAASITQGSATVGFVYDAGHQRIKQTTPDGTTLYIAGGIERFAATSGLVQWNEYLRAGGQIVGVHFTRSNATQNTRYFVGDHLGSTTILTDEMGIVVERLSYDAWGKRRYATGADDAPGTLISQTTKGFTGHEHIASVGLINMNARVYDPTIGRFMSPDSLVENFYLSQILNRYTYVGNNPLSIVDPTGRSWLSSLFRRVPILKAILAIAVAVIFQQWEVIGFLGSLGNAVVGGLISGYISGGTLQSTLLGGLQVLAFSGIHAIKDAAGILDKLTLEGVVMHGMVGGLSSVAQGGNFASGFLAAGFGELVSPFVGKTLSAKWLVLSTVAGGVGSVLGGGKFENGAITGAFGYLFNETIRYHRDREAMLQACNGQVPCAAMASGKAEDFTLEFASGATVVTKGAGIGAYAARESGFLDWIYDQLYGNRPSGLGDLTNNEVNRIQDVVNEAGRPIEVIGSAARGSRNPASDIDYIAPPGSIKYFEPYQNNLPGIDPNHGIIPGVGNKYIGPVIRFEPR